MRRILTRMLGTGLVIMFSAGLTLAAPLNNDTITKITQKLLPGSLTFQAPADVVLPDITVSTDQQTVSGTATAWKVDDARGHKPSQAPGWSLTMTSTDLSDGDPTEPSTIPVTGLTITPTNLVANSGNVTGVSLGGSYTFASTTDQATIATASTGAGRGQFQGDINFSWIIPANSDAATYQATWTFTLQ